MISEIDDHTNVVDWDFWGLEGQETGFHWKMVIWVIFYYSEYDIGR